MSIHQERVNGIIPMDEYIFEINEGMLKGRFRELTDHEIRRFTKEYEIRVAQAQQAQLAQAQQPQQAGSAQGIQNVGQTPLLPGGIG